jgi:uncharacterized SAM-binding protein YcdF (DUF218 family)
MVLDNQTFRLASELWNFHAIQEELHPCDAIVGLGSYDSAVAEECARLFQQQMGKVVIFTGKEGNWTKGKSDLTEAEEFAVIAQNMGVPENCIVLEKSATNIGQNVTLSKKIMDERGLKSAIFVTKPQTKLRVRLTINKQINIANSIVHSPPYTMEEFIAKFGTDQLINEMVGDISRIISYPALGFQEAVEIPGNVMAAFEALKVAGYTKHI